MLQLDHLVIKTETLEAGVAWAEARLGVALLPGGQHLHFGTHNALLGLGDTYLEVIAIDPSLPGPDRPRWFGLDVFDGAPVLGQWALASNDLAGDVVRLGAGFGELLKLSRGDFSWSMAVPETGLLPFDNMAPGLLQWHSSERPQDRLETRGCGFESLVVSHPDADKMQADLAPLFTDARVRFETGSPKLKAEISTPYGLKTL